MAFWRRKKKKKKKIDATIQTIPDVFYGGKDPTIYHEPAITKTKHTRKTKERIASPRKKKPVTPKKTRTPRAPRRSRFTGLWAKKSIRYTMFVLIGLLIIGGVSWFHIARVLGPDDPPDEDPIVVTPPPPPPPPPTTTPPITPVTSTPPVATTTPSDPSVLTFPRIFLTNGTDFDADELTDVEEEIFGTDSGAWDTDGDGYYDGQEIANLYSPKGFAPTRLIDSGLVKEYTNPFIGYRLYYPASWEVGVVDDGTASHVLFSAITGDFVEVRVFEKATSQSFVDWFGDVAVGQQYTDLTPRTNRFAEQGFVRTDGLVAYFVDTTRVYVLIYHNGTSGIGPYRYIMNMVVQSFRPSDDAPALPPQPILPSPPAPTPLDTATSTLPTPDVPDDTVTTTPTSTVPADAATSTL